MEHKPRWLTLLRKAFPLLLVAVIVGWGVWYVAAHPEELAAIETLSPGWLLLLFGLATVKIGCMGLFTKYVVSALGIEMDFLEWFGVSGMSTMANYLTPFRGGAAVRAVYLKSRHGLSYSLFLSTLTTLYILSFASSAAVGLLAVIALYLGFGVASVSMAFFFLGVLFMPLVFFVLVRVASHLLKRCTAKRTEVEDSGLLARAVSRGIGLTQQVMEGWQIISSRPATILRLLWASLLNDGVTLLMIHVAFVAFGARLPLLASLVLSSLFMISSLLPLTPSGLGIAEIAVVLTSQGLGVPGSLSVLSAGLNRAIMILASFLWGALFTYILGRRATAGLVGKEVEPCTRSQ